MNRRVGVTGGRDFTNEELARCALELLLPNDIIIHGAARGADSLFARLASEAGFQTVAYPADWNKHGKAAGPIRNQEMLKSGLDLLIVFPGGKGTEHMTNICRRARVSLAFPALMFGD